MDLISRERNGREFILRTTDYFADYFGLSRNVQAMKRQLKRIFNRRGEEKLPADGAAGMQGQQSEASK